MLAGKTLGELQLPERQRLLAMGLRHDGRLSFVPTSEDRIGAHDRLLLFGPDEALQAFGR
jgi:Trk K+ transport system NAD-binding subunit